MRRLGITVLVSLAMLLSVTATALAGYDWCCGDPVLDINGAEVSIITAVPSDRVDDMAGPMMVYVRVSEDVPVGVKLITGDFDEEVVFVRMPAKWNGKSAIPVGIEARVDSESGDPIPVKVEVLGDRVKGDLKGQGDGVAYAHFTVLPAAR